VQENAVLCGIEIKEEIIMTQRIGFFRIHSVYIYVKHVTIFLEDLNPCPYPDIFMTKSKKAHKNTGDIAEQMKE
jgi:hypothetical protein